MAKRCFGCMREKNYGPICEHCGHDERSANAKHQLQPGTVVGGQYILGRVLGQGGFGITYLGWDTIMHTAVAVKEYYPNGYAVRDTRRTPLVASYDSRNNRIYDSNKKRFFREAETLASLWDIPQIVRVLRCFEENNTVYIAMEYVQGSDLRMYLRNRGRTLSMQETLRILDPVMQALSAVHSMKFIHRDVSPDNVMLQSNGGVKLIDFGAARFVMKPNAEGVLSTSTQTLLKHGFAPPEQYESRGALGPWTDIYAMCATIYFCLTGSVPSEAMNRMMSGARVEWARVPGLTARQRKILEKGMALRPRDRLGSMEELRRELWRDVQGTKPERIRSATIGNNWGATVGWWLTRWWKQ